MWTEISEGVSSENNGNGSITWFVAAVHLVVASRGTLLFIVPLLNVIEENLVVVLKIRSNIFWWPSLAMVFASYWNHFQVPNFVIFCNTACSQFLTYHRIFRNTVASNPKIRTTMLFPKYADSFHASFWGFFFMCSFVIMSKDNVSLVYSGKTICVNCWPCSLLAHKNNKEKPNKCAHFEINFNFCCLFIFRTSWVHPRGDSCMCSMVCLHASVWTVWWVGECVRVCVCVCVCARCLEHTLLTTRLLTPIHVKHTIPHIQLCPWGWTHEVRNT